MAKNKRKPNKVKGERKKFPGNFFLLLLAAIFVAMLVQNFMAKPIAQIGFSYQLEHLVNLDLIKPENSKKVSLKGELVNFSGNFRDEFSEESKQRFKYLEILDESFNLQEAESEVVEEINLLKPSIEKSASLFLAFSGIEIPPGGYWVVEPSYSSNYIVVKKVQGEFENANFPVILNRFETVSLSPDKNGVALLGSNVAGLLKKFKSNALGIGNPEIRKKLDASYAKVLATTPFMKGKDNLSDCLVVYKNALGVIAFVIQQLNSVHDHVRLVDLRDVRDYKATLEEMDKIEGQKKENRAKLEKARIPVLSTIWFFNDQELSVRGLETQDSDAYHKWFAEAKEQWENFPNNKGLAFKAPDQPLNLVLNKTFRSEAPSKSFLGQLFVILPIILIILLIYFLFSRGAKGVGASAMNFGKSPARLLTDENNKVSFKDVAGVDEALEELEEIVEFLKKPSKFTVLGGRIPKGVLCIGPPGTGKTLIAKAVAGEAECPFFSISGSSFVEMFVGVGASRIRDMFAQAKKSAPCIIFVDEIDAVGRHRGGGIGGGHDEREQTLNQLLVEMDGFETNEGIILMAATNRPDVLDSALLRPGRFDRRVTLDLPDIKGRCEILNLHARKIKLDSAVDLMDVARATPGASGADLENILNEAALLAARRNRAAVTAQETTEACDKVRFGKERRSLEISEEDKKTTAIHESGHTIVGAMLEHVDPIEKVTIIPRGFALGATHVLPEKNKLGYWKKELLDQLAFAMGGRAAEEIFIKDMSSGAQHDIEQATNMARSMVCEWGMTDILGTVAYDEHVEKSPYIGIPGYREKMYSEVTAQAIDKEVRKIIDEAHERAIELLENNKEKVQLMTEMLIEFETLNSEDIKKIIDDSWDIEEKKQRLQKEIELHKKKVKESSKRKNNNPSKKKDKKKKVKKNIE